MPGSLARIGGQSGSVGILFAASIVALTAFVGLAIDYTSVARGHDELQSELDALTVNLAVSGGDIYERALGVPANTAVEITESTKTYSKKRLEGTTKRVKSVTASFSGQRTRDMLEVRSSATGKVDLAFGRLFGKESVDIEAESVVTTPMPKYIDFTLVLDASQSMGLAATPESQMQMEDLSYSLTKDRCALACHDKRSKTSKDTFVAAQRAGISLRINVLEEATRELINLARDAEKEEEQYRFALYTFTTEIKELISMTSNFDTAIAATYSIDLPEVSNPTNYTETDIKKTLLTMNSRIKAQGTGVSKNSPRQLVMLVTDGVENWWDGKRRVNPLDPTHCNSLKARGITVAVLYTRYLPIPTNQAYRSYVAPFASDIPVKLKACASSGFYYEASKVEEIHEAFKLVFTTANDQIRVKR